MKRNSNIDKIMNLAGHLSVTKQKELIEQIMLMMDSPMSTNGCNQLVEEFNNGRPDCPHCRAKANLGYIIRKGKRKNGAQRYFCKVCRHFFVPSTNTAFARSRKSSDTWKKFIELTINGKSLEVCSEECNIAYQTAFTWRHKLLNAFRTNQNATMMCGNVEIDEMLIPISYKGNHISGEFGARKIEKGQSNNLPRPSYRRGSDNRSSSSKDKACVFCMVDNSNKNFYGVVPGVGFMTDKMLDATILPHINCEKALVLADQYRITKNYLDNHNYKFKILSSNTSENKNEHKPEVKNGLHMQHVNAMHRHIRRFLANYCGVSTKYLENYISLFIWIKTANCKKQRKIIKNISIGRAAMADCYITRKELDAKSAIPLCA